MARPSSNSGECDDTDTMSGWCRCLHHLTVLYLGGRALSVVLSVAGAPDRRGRRVFLHQVLPIDEKVILGFPLTPCPKIAKDLLTRLAPFTSRILYPRLKQALDFDTTCYNGDKEAELKTIRIISGIGVLALMPLVLTLPRRLAEDWVAGLGYSLPIIVLFVGCLGGLFFKPKSNQDKTASS